MTNLIFINYRRRDTAGYALALQMGLESGFEGNDIFMDVSGSIEPGDDFLESINRGVGSSMVVLAVIGPRWVELLRASPSDPVDYVVLEIASALRQGKRVIPILVDDTSMPSATELPEDIRPLARRNAFRLRIETFRSDCVKLLDVLKRQIADMGSVEEGRRTSTARRIAESEAPTVGKSLADTVWKSRDSDNDDYVFRFMQDGILNYTSPTGTYDNGRWTQDGSLVVFDMNNHYSTYTAELKNSSTMVGSGSNINKKHWTFRAERVEQH